MFYKHKNNKDGLAYQCKGCNKEHKKQYYVENKEKILKKNQGYYEKNFNSIKNKRKEWRENNLDHLRDYKLQLKYGIDLSGYKEMLQEQDGVCSICQTYKNEQLCVDHCHQTGIVRGLLCKKCNTVIGMLNDDVDILKNAIQYLENIDG